MFAYLFIGTFALIALFSKETDWFGKMLAAFYLIVPLFVVKW